MNAQTNNRLMNRQKGKISNYFSQHTSNTMDKIVIKNASITLKAPITTAADDIHKYFFIVFQRK